MVRPTDPLAIDHLSSKEPIGDDNNTTTSLSDDPLFYICWGRQSCDGCLKGDVPCSWCPVTSTCVPNRSRLPILAPFGSSQICPLGSEERWELRAVPFGCHVSTITFVTACVAVLGTLGVIGLGFLAMRLGCRLRRWGDGKLGFSSMGWRERLASLRRWWRRGRSGYRGANEDGQEGYNAEREPLLG